jgi:hypothetical protein
VALIRIDLVLAPATTIAWSAFTVIDINLTLVPDKARRTVACEGWYTELVTAGASIEARV